MVESGGTIRIKTNGHVNVTNRWRDRDEEMSDDLASAIVRLKVLFLLQGNFGAMGQCLWYPVILSYLILAPWLGLQASAPCGIEQAICIICVSNPVSQATHPFGPQ